MMESRFIYPLLELISDTFISVANFLFKTLDRLNIAKLSSLS